MNIGANIRHMREEQKLSQVELAHKLGVSQSMLCQIERGSKSPSLPLSVEIAAALGCELEQLTAR